jgi:thiol peroxidase
MALCCSILTEATAADLTANLPERISAVTANGSPLQLQGEVQVIGQAVPDFKLANTQLHPVRRVNFTGKYLLIQTVPSLDTELGRQLAKHFIAQTAALPEQVSSILVSTDVAFAQSRFAATVELNKVSLYSDAVWGDFGSSFGLRIKDVGLLASALLLIGPDGTLLHQQLAKGLEQPADITAVLSLLPSPVTPLTSQTKAPEAKVTD